MVLFVEGPVPWTGSWIMIIPSDFINKALDGPFGDAQSSTSQLGDSFVLLPGGAQKHLVTVGLGLISLRNTHSGPDTGVEFGISPGPAPLSGEKQFLSALKLLSCRVGPNEDMRGRSGCPKPAVLADVKRESVPNPGQGLGKSSAHSL
ncbi:hypothetical protein MDA_GLEAN10009964 [Myotis davidii]|uniref:Uncharacterized protein n=1 Tax=Myotis davidii TaxID=225400 RepID=L5LNH3_MYODS|nr:hypothetical protein MDA_GLEAN10009964 [Myotis davidii]